MEKKILVIGSEGFVGKTFIKYHTEHANSNEELFMVDIKNIKKKNYFNCNATNPDEISNIIQEIKPEEIYNFSGSFSNNFEIDYLNNVILTKNIFDSILLNNLLKCKILIIGSAAEYGFIKESDNPIKENYPLNPVSFYGLSKVIQTYLAKTYFIRDNIKVYLTRPFNVIGYGSSQNLFIGKLIKGIESNLKRKEKIYLGNLENERDYLDIEDLINAYEKIIKYGNPGEIYNIGSGKCIKIRDILNIFLKVFKIDIEEVEVNNSLNKKYDVPKIMADISKLKKLNWNLKISMLDSVQKIKKLMYK